MGMAIGTLVLAGVCRSLWSCPDSAESPLRRVSHPAATCSALPCRVDTHGFFVLLGRARRRARSSSHEARRRGQTDERLLYVVMGALVGGAVFMRLGTWLQHVDLRAERQRSPSSGSTATAAILGGLVGAWLGVHVAKRLRGYRAAHRRPVRPGRGARDGGRAGSAACSPSCPAPRPARRGGSPSTPAAAARTGAPAGVPLHPSFVYEIVFHLRRVRRASGGGCVAAACRRARSSSGTSRRTASSGSSSSSCAATRSSWHGLTRPQLFLARHRPARRSRASSWQARRGAYRDAMRPREQGRREHDRMSRDAAARRPHPPLRQRVLPASATRSEPDRPLAEVQRLSGWLVERDGRIWLERGCADHGLVRTLYDESPEILTLPRAVDGADQGHEPDVARQLHAGARGVRRRPARDADPAHLHPARGPRSTTATCKCPTCFAESSPGRWRPSRRSTQVLASIDARLSRENGRIDVLMLSGGEPTLYPWLAELLDAVAARPIVRVLVNTNGLRIAQDDALLDLLTRHRERVEVYLQYDGESAEASAYHRGADIRRFKERAIERLSGAGIFTTLTMTAALGVNDDEIGARDQARAGHAVRRRRHDPAGVRLAAGPARIDPLDRLTHTGVLARLEEQTAGEVTWRDLTALPVLAPALLLGRLPAARRLRHLAVADRADRPRPAQAVARPRARPAGQPDRRRRHPRPRCGRSSRARCSTCSRSSRRCRTRRWRRIWRDICQNCDLGIGTLTHARGLGAARAAQAAAARCWGSGCCA